MGCTKAFGELLWRVDIKWLCQMYLDVMPRDVQVVLGKGPKLTIDDLLSLPRQPDEFLMSTGVYIDIITRSTQGLGNALYTGSATAENGHLTRWRGYDRPDRATRESRHGEAFEEVSATKHLRALAAFPPGVPRIYKLLLETVVMVLLGTFRHTSR